MKTNGLRILVTGGGSGIGLAVARRLARDNSVVIAGRDEGRLDRAMAQAPGLRVQVLDVASEEETRRAIDRVADELGGLDLVIHAAGAMHAFDISGSAAADLAAREVEINFIGSERIARLTLPILRRSDTAALVLITSVVALVPAPGFAVYSATKAAVHSLARSLRHDHSADGIRVVEVLPTWVDTDLTRGFEVAKLTPDDVAIAIIDGLARDRDEIPVGRTRVVALADRISPRLAQALVDRASRPRSGD
jgi:short-subunit dehydrogenase involved in D-alanine esterification of teichoic acids